MWLRFWNWLGFGREKQEVAVNDAASLKIKPMKVAIIVGHEKTKKGMKLYTGEYEYDWNDRIAKKLLKAYKGPHELKVFYRDHIGITGVAQNAAGWGAEMSIELHINAAGIPSARGCEVLVLDKDKTSEKKALIVAKMLSETMGVKLRHTNGLLVLKTKDRGVTNLRKCKDAGVKTVILLEPFFGDYETDESKAFVKNEGKYVDFLCSAIDA